MTAIRWSSDARSWTACGRHVPGRVGAARLLATKGVARTAAVGWAAAIVEECLAQRQWSKDARSLSGC